MGIGSCAGDLLLKRIDDQSPSPFGLTGATGERRAFGRFRGPVMESKFKVNESFGFVE